MEVDFATKEGIEVVSWYNICKVFSIGDFVSVTSLRGITGWVEHIVDDSVYLLEYKEKGNILVSSDITVSFILILANIYTDMLICLTAT